MWDADQMWVCLGPREHLSSTCIVASAFILCHAHCTAATAALEPGELRRARCRSSASLSAHLRSNVARA